MFFYAHKKHKIDKKHRKYKKQTSDFHLDVFYTRKKHKKRKKHRKH